MTLPTLKSSSPAPTYHDRYAPAPEPGDEPEARPWLTALVVLMVIVCGTLLAAMLAGNYRTWQDPNGHGFWADQRRDLERTVRQGPNGAALARWTMSVPDTDRICRNPNDGCVKIGIPGSTVLVDVSVVNVLAIHDLRWWVPDPQPLDNLWIAADVPATDRALAYRLARSGVALRPQNYTIDTATFRANAQRSAEQALRGTVANDSPVDRMTVVQPSDDGLHATALFGDGLTLPMQRASVQAPWTITTQGPATQLQAFLTALSQASPH